MFATSLENPNERHHVLEQVAHRWVEQNATEALAWAETLDGADRDWATRAILHRLANDDPRHAVAVYEELAPTLPEQGQREGSRLQIARELAGHWSATAPGEAASWALTLPTEGEIQRAAVREVAEHWMRLDSISASEWISQLPEGRTRDGAAGVVVEQISRTDQESAFAWATSIADEGYQSDLMHHVLERWIETDPDSARAALGDPNVSGELRARFERQLGAPSRVESGADQESVPD